MQKKIAILGGNFNPIHLGHLIMAQSVYLTNKFTEVWLMPSGRHPFKLDDNRDKRLAMCQLATKGIPYLTVSSFEADKEKVSYTYKTLEELSRKYKNNNDPIDFWWIIGEDNIYDLERWFSYEKLLKKYKFVIIKRNIGEKSLMTKNQLTYLTDRYNFKYILVESPLIGISSSMIRNRLANDLPIDYLSPKQVVDYINANKLYKTKDNESKKDDIDYAKIIPVLDKKLQEILEKPRYEHSLRVAETAVKIAKNYKVSTDKVRLAGLFHDYAKNFSEKKKRKLCEKYKIHLSEVEEKNIDLSHGKIAARIAKYEYNINDKDILNAINWHTTGRPNMSTIEKIIYIADAIEPKRNSRDAIIRARKYAYVSLDKTMYILLEGSLKYLSEKKLEAIDPMTRKAFDYYRDIMVNHRI